LAYLAAGGFAWFGVVGEGGKEQFTGSGLWGSRLGVKVRGRVQRLQRVSGVHRVILAHVLFRSVMSVIVGMWGGVEWETWAVVCLGAMSKWSLGRRVSL